MVHIPVPHGRVEAREAIRQLLARAAAGSGEALLLHSEPR
jgi:hypothetical protein